MFQTLINAFKNPDVRKKIFITLGLLLIYRLGCWLPIPGINPSVYDVVNPEGSAANTLLSLLSAITGGALAQGAILAIGVSPYINASIIIQLLTVAIPKLEEWSKQGEEGRKKINRVTRVTTLILAIAQAAGIVVSWVNGDGISADIFGANTKLWAVAMMVAVILIGGSMFTMWLGERITEVGVGNGISLLIFVGILSSAGTGLIAVIGQIPGSATNEPIFQLIAFLLLVVIIFTFIVFIDLAERRVPIQYAKQIKGRKQYGGQNTHIPIKVNASGVLPIIFANAIITFPQLLFSLFLNTDNAFYAWWMKWMGVGTPVYSVAVGILILLFSFFYAQIQFNPEEVARNIQQYGGFIPGIRPGKPTSEYLSRISKRLTFFGAVFLAFIAIVPAIIFNFVFSGQASLVNAFSATGMLIVVSVALEFDKQLQSQLMMKQYKGFLK
ncbi:MAG: preprotein translocase subunit SecY [Clostridiales bacterium]|jgi:preprotein translocase subunit SecY|nr:preprotein translocase subunit SecY [Clostridiales bacterium]